MVPPPIALGLSLCETFVVEEGTSNVSLINTFHRRHVERFPSPPQQFGVYAVLTSGLGDATIELVINRLDTDEEIYVRRFPWHFSDRLMEVRILYRIKYCSFPKAGVYQATLLVDGDWIAHRRFQAALMEG